MKACPLRLFGAGLDRFHLGGHSSESTVYIGSYPDAIRERQLMRLSLGEPLKRRRLAHLGWSESAYTGFYLDGHSSESTAYIRPYSDGYGQPPQLSLGESPERRRLAHLGCSKSV